MQALEALLVLLEANSNEDKPLVINAMSSLYCYKPHLKTIHLDKNNPSIISTMHEFSHWLNGPSELEACRFSVWLFKEVFPKSFALLETHGHMLKRRVHVD